MVSQKKLLFIQTYIYINLFVSRYKIDRTYVLVVEKGWKSKYSRVRLDSMHEIYRKSDRRIFEDCSSYNHFSFLLSLRICHTRRAKYKGVLRRALVQLSYFLFVYVTMCAHVRVICALEKLTCVRSLESFSVCLSTPSSIFDSLQIWLQCQFY